MLNFRPLVRGFSRVACVAAAAVGLAGCYNVDATINFRDDGTAGVASRLDFPRDAEHVAKLYQAMLELQPGMSRFFGDGLCQSVDKFAALVPDQRVAVQGREYTTETRFGCGFLYEAGDSAQFVDGFARLPPGTRDVIRLEHLAPRRVRVTLDFDKMPDISSVMPGLIMLGALKYGMPGQALPNMAAINKLTGAYANAAMAVARMTAADNHVQIAIRARRVIETNGEVQGDLVFFRWSWEDFTRLMLRRAEGGEDGPAQEKVFYAVIEY